MIKLMIIDEYKIVNYSGGIERVICNLANALIEKNYVVDIVCLDTEKGRPAYHLDERVRFINLAFVGKPYKNLTLLLRKLQKEILRAIAGSKMILFGKKIQDPKYNYFTNQFINRLRKVVIEKQPDIILSVLPDLNAYDIESAIKCVEGTARNMGIKKRRQRKIFRKRCYKSRRKYQYKDQ